MNNSTALQALNGETLTESYRFHEYAGDEYPVSGDETRKWYGDDTPTGVLWTNTVTNDFTESEGGRAVSDYREVFGRDPAPWREPLGALRLTLTGDPAQVDVVRAQAECEELVRVLNGGPK